MKLKLSDTSIILVGYIVLLLCAILILTSCNPVKQVLKDKQKLDEVAEIVVRSGYCANDTTIVTKSDTTVVHDTAYQTDTLIEVSIQNDTQYVTLPRKVITRTVTIRDTIKSVVVDNARVSILQKDILKLRSEAIDLREEAGKWKSLAKKRWWLLVLLAGAVAGYVLRKPIKLAIFGKI